MKEFNTNLKELASNTDSDFYVFVATINDQNADKFISIIRDKHDKKKVCSLILTTFGGDPDAGYRTIRAIKRYYEKLTLYVFGTCKSTGTLMALGADEIVMSDFGEFGPLDIQLTKDDELSNTSGLNFVQSLLSLNEQLFRAFEDNFLSLKRRSQNTITTRTAAEICTKLSVGLISPISAQIDPVKLGEVQRAIRIANEYGSRLCDNNELITKLIVSYPSHGFVIDYEEAKDIFHNVRWVKEKESILEKFLYRLVRKESSQDLITFLDYNDDESEEENVPHETGFDEKVLTSQETTGVNEDLLATNLSKNGTNKRK